MSRLRLLTLSVFLCGLSVVSVALSADLTLHVAASGGDYTSIQAAINQCATTTRTTSNSYHTINIAAGTYSIDTGESFITLPRNGNDYDGLGLITNSMTLINIPATNNLIGLRLIGAARDTCIIDAQQTNRMARVMYIAADDVEVSNMTIKGGWLAGYPETKFAGAGALIHGDNVRIDNVRFTECKIKKSNAGIVATGKFIDSGLKCGNHLRLSNSEIDNNISLSQTGISRSALNIVGSIPIITTYTIINTSIHDNTTTVPDPKQLMYAGIAINIREGHVVIFGSLIENNDEAALVVAVETPLGFVYMANSTIVDHENLLYDVNKVSDQNRLVNNIFSDDSMLTGTDYNVTGVSRFLYNFLDVPDFSFTNTCTADGDFHLDINDIQWGRPGGTDPSDDGSNNTNDPPGFVNQTIGDYRLAKDSLAIDAGGLLLTGTSGFKYVDLDDSTNYTAGLDVIVKLSAYSPSSADIVVLTDLDGNPRLKGDSIEPGCYEFQPPTGTIIIVK